jgi:hypothetical protein
MRERQFLIRPLLAIVLLVAAAAPSAAYAHTLTGPKELTYYYPGSYRLCDIAGLDHVPSGGTQFRIWNQPSRYSISCGSGALTNTCTSASQCVLYHYLFGQNAGLLTWSGVVLTNNSWANDTISWYYIAPSTIGHNCSDWYFAETQYFQAGATSSGILGYTNIHNCV